MRKKRRVQQRPLLWCCCTWNMVLVCMRLPKKSSQRSDSSDSQSILCVCVFVRIFLSFACIAFFLLFVNCLIWYDLWTDCRFYFSFSFEHKIRFKNTADKYARLNRIYSFSINDEFNGLPFPRPNDAQFFLKQIPFRYLIRIHLDGYSASHRHKHRFALINLDVFVMFISLIAKANTNWNHSKSN